MTLYLLKAALHQLTLREMFFHPLFQVPFLLATFLMATPLASTEEGKTTLYLLLRLLAIPLLVYAFLFKTLKPWSSTSCAI